MTQENVSAFSFYKHIRKYLSQNISLADSKARTVILVSLILLAIFFALDVFLFGDMGRIYSTVQIIFWVLTVIVIFASFFCGLMVLLPKTAPAKKGFIYWGASLNFSLEEYRDELRLLSKDEILNELAVVNYNLGLINKRKFLWSKWSIIFAILAFVLICVDVAIFTF